MEVDHQIAKLLVEVRTVWRKEIGLESCVMRGRRVASVDDRDRGIPALTLDSTRWQSPCGMLSSLPVARVFAVNLEYTDIHRPFEPAYLRLLPMPVYFVVWVPSLRRPSLLSWRRCHAEQWRESARVRLDV